MKLTKKALEKELIKLHEDWNNSDLMFLIQKGSYEHGNIDGINKAIVYLSNKFDLNLK